MYCNYSDLDVQISWSSYLLRKCLDIDGALLSVHLLAEDILIFKCTEQLE